MIAVLLSISELGRLLPLRHGTTEWFHPACRSRVCEGPQS